VNITNSGSLNGKTVSVIAGGGFHSLAICTDGTVHAWGRNSSGQLGDGTGTLRASPVNITTRGSLNGKTVSTITGGRDHSLALCTDGTVHAWGVNGNGQVGDGTTSTKVSPVNISTSGSLNGKTVSIIAGGDNHSLALCTDGTVHAWGLNTSNQLGDGTVTQQNSPVNITNNGSLNGKTVSLIAGGRLHSLAICTDGTVHAWGRNSEGQLGDGSTTTRNSPVNITANVLE
jgi:alpha-tubulin suppressor-like RCC1 family protein